MTRDQLYVTKPSLPPIEDFIPYLKKIWETKHLTNGGPFHKQLEESLCEYLGVKQISLFANGTIALVTALKALDVKGEVITTPFSFVATAHSILWNGLTPVFVDIDPETLNIDPAKVEAAITPQTTAILPVHCYGNPCDVASLKNIADIHNLKIIYDAAHAFGVRCDNGSILNHGDLSVLSFHATKVYNTFEGGAIVSHDIETKLRIDRLKNFGFVNETTIIETGINGKMSEFNAAFGLLQLQHLDAELKARQKADAKYRRLLKGVDGISCVAVVAGSVSNYSYFPILVENSYPLSRDELYEKLRENGIYARRYFHPLISHFPMYAHGVLSRPNKLPVAENAASRVICLPIFPAITEVDIERIATCLGAQ